MHKISHDGDQQYPDLTDPKLGTSLTGPLGAEITGRSIDGAMFQPDKSEQAWEWTAQATRVRAPETNHIRRLGIP